MLVPLEKPTRDVRFGRKYDPRKLAELNARIVEQCSKQCEDAVLNLVVKWVEKAEKMLEQFEAREMPKAYVNRHRASYDDWSTWGDNVAGNLIDDIKKTFEENFSGTKWISHDVKVYREILEDLVKNGSLGPGYEEK